MEQSEGDSMKTALENHIILREISSHLELSDLKRCRLVNKFWETEVSSSIRELYYCGASISEENPCASLDAFHEIIASGMSRVAVVPINSLTITFNGDHVHSECKSTSRSRNNSKIYTEIISKLPVKYLEIKWDSSFRNMTCPAVQFATDFFREKITELHTLKIRVAQEFSNIFDQLWNPCSLPKLQSLEVVGCDNFLHKIISHAPNLNELYGQVDCKILNVLPQEKYSVLQDFSLSIDSDEDEKLCIALAKAGPKLWWLYFRAPGKSKRHHMPSFLEVLGKLLTSSRKTLRELCLFRPNFPLNLVTFPGLVNVREIVIYTPESGDLLLNLLRSIDYPAMLPALSKVVVVGERVEPGDEENPWLVNDNNVAVGMEVHGSTTVKVLDLGADCGPFSAEDLREIFPNLSTLDIRNLTDLSADTTIPYGDLWAAWPQLKTINLMDRMVALECNFDAEFLGIHPDEVKALREEYDDTLEKMHIVPVRPSILTMTRLKSLRILIQTDEFVQAVDPDKVFLSRLTGVLAFRKMTRMGISVELFCTNPEILLALNHLVPYVSVGLEED